MFRTLSAIAIAVSLVAGCAASSELDTTVKLLREGDEVLSGMDDLETGRVATIARLERLEEAVRLAPQSAPLRKMLVSGWARYALLFVEDDLEEARERADAPSASYHAMRARNAYERAIHHGREYLGGAAFDQAVASDGVAAFLAQRQGDEAEALLWMGAAWLGRVRVGLEDRKQLGSQARVGEALLERSIALDPKGSGGWAQLALGLWLGRQGGDLERAKQQLDKAAEGSGRKLLLTQVVLARTVVCQAHDREKWDALFKEVLEARDPEPMFRIDNAAAKRRAARDVQGTRRAQCVP